MIRFKKNVSTAGTQEAGRCPALSAEELREAERLVVGQVQKEAFSQEISALKNGGTISSSSSLLQLTPQLDPDDLLRVGGRLANAPLAEVSRHPLILPRDNRITTLIIDAIHQQLMHAGADHVLNELRQTFWVPRARQAVKKVVMDCPSCRRRRAQPCQPRMADLPAARFDTRHAFSSIGNDFFGPLMVKTHGRRTEKRWCMLVTCLTTRGLHLEVTHTLDTQSFLMGFRRFVARRGPPSEVFSDNGSCLRAGEKELRQLLRQWNQHAISDELTQQNIRWHFNPPAACDMSGVWERMVGTVKRSLRAVLGRLIVTDEVLHTVLAEVEAVVNSRPLTHVSTEPSSLEALTPSHLLLGRPTSRLPPGLFQDGDTSSRRAWRQSQALAEQLWRRWLREYVPGLACRRKWMTETRNLQVGDLVLLVESGITRGQWPLGRVIEVVPGPDSRVRSARVRVRGGELHRPVRRLCLLEEA